MKRLMNILILVLFSGALLTACGSDTSSPPAPGTAPSNPIVMSAAGGTGIYTGTVGTSVLYIKAIDMMANYSYSVLLNGLTDNANLYVYSDAFSTELCRSAQAGTTIELCGSVMTNAAGELYIKVDGSQTSSGTSFTLTVGT